MNDRELLELAAKAAGIEGGWGPVFKIGDDEVDVSDIWFLDAPETGSIWGPLTDDGDALRLSVKLKIEIRFLDGFKQVSCRRHEGFDCHEKYGIVGYGAGTDEDPTPDNTRRAIVRAAAEIGRAMP